MVFNKFFSFINDPFKDKKTQSSVNKQEDRNSSSTNHYYFINKGELNEVKKMFLKYKEQS